MNSTASDQSERSMTHLPALEGLIERCEKGAAGDWRLNDEIIAALGGTTRRVTRLGRTKGSMRVFWEGDTSRQGKRYPNFLATAESKARAIKALRSLTKLEG
jgi:hypothetical protein